LTFSPTPGTSKAISQVCYPAPEFAYTLIYLVDFYLGHIAPFRLTETEFSINGRAGQANTPVAERFLLTPLPYFIIMDA
jgi:hypothetical protein